MQQQDNMDDRANPSSGGGLLLEHSFWPSHNHLSRTRRLRVGLLGSSMTEMMQTLPAKDINLREQPGWWKESKDQTWAKLGHRCPKPDQGMKHKLLSSKVIREMLNIFRKVCCEMFKSLSAQNVFFLLFLQMNVWASLCRMMLVQSLIRWQWKVSLSSFELIVWF